MVGRLQAAVHLNAICAAQMWHLALSPLLSFFVPAFVVNFDHQSRDRQRRSFCAGVLLPLGISWPSCLGGIRGLHLGGMAMGRDQIVLLLRATSGARNPNLNIGYKHMCSSYIALQ